MPVFNIFIESSLGVSHSEEVCVYGDGNVELTDEEVRQLVDLIRENGGSTDVEELRLEERYPVIYDKLDEACCDASHQAEWIDWVIDGYRCSYYDVETEDAIKKCEEHYAFRFEFDKDRFLEENPDYEEEDIDEDLIEEKKEEAFWEWVEKYRGTLNEYDEASFLADVFEIDPEIDYEEYSVEIPVDIVKMAKDVKA